MVNLLSYYIWKTIYVKLCKINFLIGYYMPGMEDKLLVERLLNSCLVPFNLESEVRMKKLLLLFATIDDNASKAFIEVIFRSVLFLINRILSFEFCFRCKNIKLWSVTAFPIWLLCTSRKRTKKEIAKFNCNFMQHPNIYPSLSKHWSFWRNCPFKCFMTRMYWPSWKGSLTKMSLVPIAWPMW